MRALCTTCQTPTEISLTKGTRLADTTCTCGGTLRRPAALRCASCNKRTSHTAEAAWVDKAGLLYPAGTPGCLGCGVFFDQDYYATTLPKRILWRNHQADSGARQALLDTCDAEITRMASALQLLQAHATQDIVSTGR